jgi:hypothetical protein
MNPARSDSGSNSDLLSVQLLSVEMNRLEAAVENGTHLHKAEATRAAIRQQFPEPGDEAPVSEDSPVGDGIGGAREDAVHLLFGQGFEVVLVPALDGVLHLPEGVEFPLESPDSGFLLLDFGGEALEVVDGSTGLAGVHAISLKETPFVQDELEPARLAPAVSGDGLDLFLGGRTEEAVALITHTEREGASSQESDGEWNGPTVTVSRARAEDLRAHGDTISEALHELTDKIGDTEVNR